MVTAIVSSIRCRVNSRWLQLLVLLFLGALSATASSDEVPTSWNMTGFAQGIGNSKNGFELGDTQIQVSGPLTEHCGVTIWLGFSQRDWQDTQQLRQGYVSCRVMNITVDGGRIASWSNYTTPWARYRETVYYPFADPSRGGAWGVQASSSIGSAIVRFAVTGLSGQPLGSPDDRRGLETSTRVDFSLNKEWSSAVAWNTRPDGTRWASIEAGYQLVDQWLTARGVIYGGDFLGKPFVSGYAFSEIRVQPWLGLHGMFDRGVDGVGRGTAGVRFIPFEHNRDISLTVDYTRNLKGSDLIATQVQVAF